MTGFARPERLSFKLLTSAARFMSRAAGKGLGSAARNQADM